MAPRKKAPKVKKYKSIQTATNARRVTGSVASRKVSTAYSQASRRRNQAGGPGSLSDIIVRTINGIKVPISGSSSDKKKKK
jgi:hypothetical protein